jgi:TetR/AcrR family transcriptional repressor of nem operon
VKAASKPRTAAVDTRERLLRAASAAWHERSFDGVGVAELCRRAKIHKGSFFHFFASKEALLVAVIERHAEELRAGLAAGPFAADVPPLARIARFFAGMSKTAHDECRKTGSFRGCPIGNVVAELATREEPVRAAAQGAFDVLRGAFHGALADAVRAGELPRTFAVDAAADALLAAMQGLALLGKAYRDPARLDRLGAHVLEALLPAVKARRPSSG